MIEQYLTGVIALASTYDRPAHVDLCVLGQSSSLSAL
jgi:hypothetical protein